MKIMKMNYLLIAIVALIIIIGVMVFFLMKDDAVNANISLNSNQQQNSNVTVNNNSNTNSTEQTDIQVTGLVADASVTSPLTIEGKAKGSWFFEAIFPIKITDANNNQLGYGNAQADGEWQTENYVNFTAQITFKPGTVNEGFVVMQNANPSGLKDLEKELKIPVKFVAVEKSEIEIYLAKASEQQSDCTRVSAVKRSVDKTPQIATASINQLLTGPTEDEESNDYYTSITSSARLLSLSITDGKAYADFNQELQNIGGSCRVQTVRAQIENTLKQFDSIQEVIISIEGETEGILQP